MIKMQKENETLSVYSFIKEQKKKVTPEGLVLFQFIANKKFTLKDIYFNKIGAQDAFQLRIVNPKKFIVGILPIGIDALLDILSSKTKKEAVVKDIILQHTAKQLIKSQQLIQKREFSRYVALHDKGEEMVRAVRHLLTCTFISPNEWDVLLQDILAIADTRDIAQLLGDSKFLMKFAEIPDTETTTIIQETEKWLAQNGV